MDFVDNEDPGFSRFWHPVARSADVVEGALVCAPLLGKRWAVGRANGRIVALVDACPHRLAPLSAGAIVDGTVQCEYHGYRFAADGRCVEIPSQARAAAIPPRAHTRPPAGIQERHGLVWIAPEQPIAPIIEVAEWDDEAYDCWWAEPLTTSVSAAMLTDNFLEARHFGFVHGSTFGPGQWWVESCRRRDWHLQVVTRLVDPNSEPEGEEGRQHYEVAAPFSLRDEAVRRDGTDGTYLFFVRPDSSTCSTLFFAQCFRDTHGDDDLRRRRDEFARLVLAQDFAILDRYADPRLPVDVRVEVHTKEDIGGLEYRRMLGAARTLPRPGTVDGPAAAGGDMATSQDESVPC